MSVTLSRTADNRVAVLHGVDSDHALAYLADSLLDDSAFGQYRGLVIDLGGAKPSQATAQLLVEAGRVRLRQHQLVTTASSARDVAAAVARTRRWLARFDHPDTNRLTSVVVRDLSSLRGVLDAGLSIGRGLVIRLLRRRLTP